MPCECDAKGIPGQMKAYAEMGTVTRRCTQVADKQFHRTACRVGGKAGEVGRERCEHFWAILASLGVTLAKRLALATSRFPVSGSLEIIARIR